MQFYQTSFTTDIIADISELMYSAWDEISNGINGELNVNWEQYQSLEEAGLARLYVCYDEYGSEMIGYAVFIVADSIHNVGISQAQCMTIFIKPEYRKSGAGARFIFECQKNLSELGVDVIIMAVKTKCDYSESLVRMGYVKSETLYNKRLN